jgi:hypothetical protein
VERLNIRYDDFLEEFSNILQRQAQAHRDPSASLNASGGMI